MTKNSKKEHTQTSAGIVISLEKRMPVLQENFEEPYDIVVFGHYDGMRVKTIPQWGEFRPGRVAELVGKSSLDDGIYDRYIVKACYPTLELKNMLETEYGLCYDAWEKDPTDEEYPFISCVMIHLTQYCVHENSIDAIFIEVAKIIQSVNATDRMKCSIYFSIGYSDIIVLARTKKIGDINALDQIHVLSTSSGHKWISDVYTVVGYERSLFSNRESLSTTKHTPLTNYSVSFVLKVGFSLNTFRKKLKKEMKQVFNCLGYSHDFSDFEKNVFATFGNTDVTLSLQCPERIFPALYASENVLGFYAPFHVQSQFYKKYVTTIKVSVLCDGGIDTEHLNEMHFSIPNKYINFLKELNISADKQNLPHRIVSAVMQIMKSYSILIAPEHGFEVRQLIGTAINSFIANMKIALERLEKTEGLDRSTLISNIERAVDNFRDYIGTYLSDLYRSDKSFMEGRTTTHQAIGSLSKLLFSYNAFINNLAKHLQDEKTAEEFAFVLVSGGCDKTQVDEIFGFLGPWTQGYHNLFVVAIPEISLFDINGTLFRLSHECHHCFGDRKRILRASCAQFAWAEYISDYFSQQLFSKRFYQLESLECSSLSNSKAILEKSLKRIEEERNAFREQFSELLQRYINTMDTTEEPDMVEDETNYYEVNCIRFIRLSMGLNFLISRNYISPLYRDTLSILLRHQINLLRDISYEMAHDKKSNHREILSELEYYLDHFEKISPHDMQDSFSGMLYRLFNSVTAPDQMMMEELLDDDPRSTDGKEYNALLNTIGDFSKTALNVMSECFADCMSAKRLEMRLPDFLLAFVYETWDMDKAMPENLTNVLRMGVDLKILFDISDKLEKQKWKSVVRLKDNYTNAGFELKVDLEQYHKRLNRILAKYQSLNAVGDKIICYLEACGISSADSKPKNFKDLYGKDLYEKCRNPRKSNERIYDFLDYWKKLAHTEDQ